MCASVARAMRPARRARVVSAGGQTSRSAARRSSIGTRSGAENFATQAKAKTVALRSVRGQGRFVSKAHHHALTLARRKKTMVTSDVASAPCARKLGQKAKSPSERKAPRRPKSFLDQKKIRSPVPALKSEIMARPQSTMKSAGLPER